MTALQEAAAHEYILGASNSERERLLTQCEIHRREAELLLDRIGIAAGARALDMGCGPLGALDLLSSRVGPTGKVTGLDNESRMIEFARRTIAERGLNNVELVQADAGATGLPSDSFDLAHERLVLINVPSPDSVVSEMVRIVRPRGWVAVQNVDFISWACEPAHPAWNVLLETLVRAWQAAGLDPFIGRRLPALLRRAGLLDVEVDAHAHAWRPGDLYQTLLPRFIGIFRSRIIDGNLLTPDRLDRLTEELEQHLAQSDTLVLHATLFQAWGRKPR